MAFFLDNIFILFSRKYYSNCFLFPVSKRLINRRRLPTIVAPRGQTNKVVVGQAECCKVCLLLRWLSAAATELRQKQHFELVEGRESEPLLLKPLAKKPAQHFSHARFLFIEGGVPPRRLWLSSLVSLSPCIPCFIIIYYFCLTSDCHDSQLWEPFLSAFCILNRSFHSTPFKLPVLVWR